MRVIAGSGEGPAIAGAARPRVRPTADRVKEALFSMLSSRFDLEARGVLDLFAGTGALGIEASQPRGGTGGVRRAGPRCAARPVGESDRLPAFASLARDHPPSGPAARSPSSPATASGSTVSLIDPPYGRGLADAALAQLGAGGLIAPGGWVAVEHHVDDRLGRGLRNPAVDRVAALWEDGRGVVLGLAHGGAGGGVVKRKAVYAGSFDPITNGPPGHRPAGARRVR